MISVTIPPRDPLMNVFFLDVEELQLTDFLVFDHIKGGASSYGLYGGMKREG